MTQIISKIICCCRILQQKGVFEGKDLWQAYREANQIPRGQEGIKCSSRGAHVRTLSTRSSPLDELSSLQGAEPNAEGWEWVSLDVTNYSAWERNPSTAANRGYCGSLSLSSSKNPISLLCPVFLLLALFPWPQLVESSCSTKLLCHCVWSHILSSFLKSPSPVIGLQ